MPSLPVKTVERLSRYRLVLNELMEKGDTHVFSHQLASLVGSTPAQVRRDLMNIGHSGSSKKGYEIRDLRDDISKLMDHPEGQKIAITGIGNLGRAILSYLMIRRSKLTVAAAFDNDPTKVNRVISGCRCYPIEQMDEVIRQEGITIGLISVPVASAQEIADRYVRAGIKAIVNLAPAILQVPEGIFIENSDVTLAIEKAAFYAKRK